MSVAFHKRRHASALAALHVDVPLVVPAASSVSVDAVSVEKPVEIVSVQAQPRPAQQQHNQRRDDRRR